eukprot:CAMPEP_0179985198 /NCGR_PEP_ID=MMETSP0984-20121128/1558_1 /TAXON_ID=483367 /ORGANISM="non described non described, Strain CCMP 2436" /LENGTH=50 /DNA_ID=CAMNT_0021903875 /DNA_START=87 /DNA_END=235 /DNA_ORIENTATION=-
MLQPSTTSRNDVHTVMGKSALNDGRASYGGTSYHIKIYEEQDGVLDAAEL